MVSFPELVLTASGAFFIWAVKGFKGKFNDEMVTLDQRGSLRGYTRLGLGITIWVMSLLIVGKILTKPEQQPLYFEGTTNEKGELIVKPLKSNP
ncbi:MAG: hypothetical protein JNM78_16635 [Cyclobacteriaceae bacterium]|nr:hypothetical protein [Cyclobacteriaceae bacterium]